MTRPSGVVVGIVLSCGVGEGRLLLFVTEAVAAAVAASSAEAASTLRLWFGANGLGGNVPGGRMSSTAGASAAAAAVPFALEAPEIMEADPLGDLGVEGGICISKAFVGTASNSAGPAGPAPDEEMILAFALFTLILPLLRGDRLAGAPDTMELLLFPLLGGGCVVMVVVCVAASGASCKLRPAIMSPGGSTRRFVCGNGRSMDAMSSE